MLVTLLIIIFCKFSLLNTLLNITLLNNLLYLATLLYLTFLNTGHVYMVIVQRELHVVVIGLDKII